MYKLALPILLLLCACHSSNYLVVKLKKYNPKHQNRVSLICEEEVTNAENIAPIQQLKLDTAAIYSWSFNDYQYLWNNYKKGKIDSISYCYSLQKMKNKDSLDLLNQKASSRYQEFSHDTSIDANLKLLIGVDSLKKEILLIVDANNNNNFLDDRIIKINSNNYKTIFDSLTIPVSNLTVYANEKVNNYSFPIKINSISNWKGTIDSMMKSIVAPSIDAGTYYMGSKRINHQVIYFNVFEYFTQIGFPVYEERISKEPSNMNATNAKNSILFMGKYLKINNTGYKLDTIQCKKQKCVAVFKKC